MRKKIDKLINTRNKMAAQDLIQLKMKLSRTSNKRRRIENDILSCPVTEVPFAATRNSYCNRKSIYQN
jgi:hypothetical protein